MDKKATLKKFILGLEKMFGHLTTFFLDSFLTLMRIWQTFQILLYRHKNCKLSLNFVLKVKGEGADDVDEGNDLKWAVESIRL